MTRICQSPSDDELEPVIRIYGGAKGDGFTSGQSLIEKDGSYVIGGVTQGLGSYAGNADLLLAKIGKVGEIAWAQVFGGPQMDLGKAVVRTADTGHLQAGDSFGHLHTGMAYAFGAGGDDFVLIKTDELGKLNWARTFGEVGQDIAFSAVQTVDGNFSIAGMTESHGHGKQDIFVIEFKDSDTLDNCLKAIEVHQTTPATKVSEPTLVSGQVELLYQGDSLRKQRSTSFE